VNGPSHSIQVYCLHAAVALSSLPLVVFAWIIQHFSVVLCSAHCSSAMNRSPTPCTAPGQVLGPDGRPLAVRSDDWVMTSVDPGAAVDFSIPSVFELGTVNSTGATVPVVDPRRVTLGTGVEVRALLCGSTEV
jgi:hypothetical protein